MDQSKSSQLEEALAAIRRHQPLLQARGISHAAVFGSTAMGNASKESDVDILLQPSGKAISLFTQAEIAGLLESILNRHVDIMTSSRAELNGFTNILDEAVYAF